MFRHLFNLTLIIAIVLVVIHFLPQNWKLALKDKSFATISKIIPESAKEKTKSVIYTPTEKRAKAISELEKNIGEIKGAMTVKKSPQAASNNDSVNLNLIPESVTVEEVVKKLEESEKILNEVKSNNNEQGLVSKFTTAIVEKIIKQESSSSTVCIPPSN